MNKKKLILSGCKIATLLNFKIDNHGTEGGHEGAAKNMLDTRFSGILFNIN